MGGQRVLPVINLFFLTKDTCQFIFKMEKERKKVQLEGGRLMENTLEFFSFFGTLPI